MNYPKLQRTEGTAQYFQISKMTLWRWAQDKDFPKALKRGNTVLYNIEKIEQWLEQGDAAND